MDWGVLLHDWNSYLWSKWDIFSCEFCPAVNEWNFETQPDCSVVFDTSELHFTMDSYYHDLSISSRILINFSCLAIIAYRCPRKTIVNHYYIAVLYIEKAFF